jgi:hypothetical protein
MDEPKTAEKWPFFARLALPALDRRGILQGLLSGRHTQPYSPYSVGDM